MFKSTSRLENWGALCHLKGMFGPIKSVLFDLDGTLVNSMPHTVKGLLGAIKVGTGKDISIAELAAKGFGKVPAEIIKLFVADGNLVEAERFWREWQVTFAYAHYEPFADIEKMLEHLSSKGIFMGIVTGRDREGTEKILQLHGWEQKYFPPEKVRCGDDSLKAKPAPDLLLDLVKRYSLTPESTLMVGDLPMDIEAGSRAKLRTAAVLWELPDDDSLHKTHRSFYKKIWEKWEGVPCDVRLNSPLSLLSWLD